MVRRNLLLFVAFLAIVVAVGFYFWPKPETPASSNPTASLPQQTQSLRIGYIPISDATQVFVADRLGYFSSEQLRVELIPFEGGANILQALSSGSIDVAFSNLASVVFFQKNSGPLVALAGGTLMNKNYSEAGLVVLGDSGITKIEDLKGKTAAVNSFQNIVDLAILRLLRKNGLPDSSIKRVEVPFKDMEAALRARRIDVAPLPEPILTRAMGNGSLRNLGDHFALAFEEIYSTGYFANPKDYAERRVAFDRFNRAIVKATPVANRYGEEVAQAVEAVTKIPASLLREAGRAKFIDQLPGNALPTMESLMREEGFFN